MQLAQNNRTLKDYQVLEKFQAGLELFGHEVKSIKTGLANITSSRVIVRGGEVYVVGLKMQPYQVNNLHKNSSEKSINKNTEIDRTIRLLLTRKEIAELYDIEESKKGYLIPTHLYLKNNFVKIEIGVCKKLNNHDNRQKIKERDLKRAEQN